MSTTARQWPKRTSQLEEILENLQEALVVFDLSGRIIHLNPAALSLHGFDNLQDGLQHLDYDERYQLQDAQGNALNYRNQPVQKVLRGEALNEQKLSLQRRDAPDASRAWVGLFSGKLIDRSGGFGIVTITEITEQENAKARFDTAVSLTPIPTAVVTDDELVLKQGNVALFELLGYQEDELLGRSLLRSGIFPDPAEVATALKEVNQATAVIPAKKLPLALELNTQGGETRHVKLNAGKIHLDRQPALLITLVEANNDQLTEDLIRAIDTVMQDTSWFSQRIVEQLAQIRNQHSNHLTFNDLTEREQQVLERLAQGYTNQAIAQELGIALNTVRNYLTKIYEKLGIHSRAEAIIWARERGVAILNNAKTHND